MFRSTDLDQQTVDLKRQLQIIEQEASVLRTKVQSLESENEKLTVDNKKLQLVKVTRSNRADKNLDIYIDKIATLEVELNDANSKINELEKEKKAGRGEGESDNIKIKKLQNEKEKLTNTLEKLKSDSFKGFKDRTPKKPSELTTKSQLKTMVFDLENEIGK